VTALEAAYGAPSQERFGSAVFYEQPSTSDKLEQTALAKYKFFAGNLEERYGEEAWMGHWKEVCARKAGAKPDIVAELRSITDRDAKCSVPLILDNIGDGEKARRALAAAFDDPRFPPLARDEYDSLEVEISLLSASTPIVVASERELHTQLRPGIDGVTLEWGHCRSTFLPQVWESLSDPREFIAHLKRKAGLPLDFWSTDLTVSRYTVEKFTERLPA